MIEAVAKKKVCPATLMADQISKCIASECMAWRWQYRRHPLDGDLVPVKSPDGAHHGYCGIAGRPDA